MKLIKSLNLRVIEKVYRRRANQSKNLNKCQFLKITLLKYCFSLKKVAFRALLKLNATKYIILRY